MLLPKPWQWCTSHPSCKPPPKSSCMERMRPTKGSMGWGVGQEGIKSRKEKESVLQDSLRCHVNPVLPYMVAVGQICRWVFGQHEKSRASWGWSLWLLGSVLTLASGSPHSFRAGSPCLIEMQGTGWQAAAAAYRQNPAEKGRRDGGGG